MRSPCTPSDPPPGFTSSPVASLYLQRVERIQYFICSPCTPSNPPRGSLAALLGGRTSRKEIREEAGSTRGGFEGAGRRERARVLQPSPRGGRRQCGGKPPPVLFFSAALALCPPRLRRRVVQRIPDHPPPDVAPAREVLQRGQQGGQRHGRQRVRQGGTRRQLAPQVRQRGRRLVGVVFLRQLVEDPTRLLARRPGSPVLPRPPVPPVPLLALRSRAGSARTLRRGTARTLRGTKTRRYGARRGR
eukprot:284996-Prorocentrum_minimum.AAC.1